MSSKIHEGVTEDKLNWDNTAAELDKFYILRQPGSTILSVGKADVKFTYKNHKKSIIIYGPEDAVFDRAMMIIQRKKNPVAAGKMQQEFIDKWKKAAYHKFSSSKDEVKNVGDIKSMNEFLKDEFYFGRKRNPREPKTLLENEIKKKFEDINAFADNLENNKSSVYHHTSGKREISKKVAMEYAAKLKCDPVDLMFNKLSIPVWGKVDLLKSSALLRPGEIYSLDDKNMERVIVPRDLYQDDIKAIKISARGSMYDNQVAFYYRATSKDDNCLNKLCIVGVEIPVGPPELSEDTENHYYFGLYENVRGESNLINPDPYVDVYKNKFILKNFTPKIIAPVVALVNPEAITDKTKMRGSIPSVALVREEERLQAEIAAHKKSIEQAQEVGKKQREYENQFAKLMERLKALTERIDKQEQTRTVWNPFKKDRDILAQIHPFSKLTKKNVK